LPVNKEIPACRTAIDRNAINIKTDQIFKEIKYPKPVIPIQRA